MAQRNLLAGAVLLAAGLGFGVLTAGLPERSLPNTPGPAFLPWLITVAWLVLSAALLVRGALDAKRDAGAVGGYRVPAPGWVALGGFLVYLALLPMLGFIPSSVPFFAGLMWLYGERNKLVIVLAAVGIPVVLFYLFTAGFQILLPRGSW